MYAGLYSGSDQSGVVSDYFDEPVVIAEYPETGD
jgi:hypothetical protein